MLCIQFLEYGVLPCLRALVGGELELCLSGGFMLTMRGQRGTLGGRVGFTGPRRKCRRTEKLNG